MGPNSFAPLWVIKVVESVLNSTQIFDLRNLDERRSKVQHVAYKERKPGVLDPQLNWNAHVVRDLANVYKIFFAERAVLSIDSKEVVISKR